MDAWIISLTHDICEAEARSCRSCKHSSLSRMKEEGRKEVEAGVDLERRANRGGDSGEEKRACSKSSLRPTEEDEAEARAIQLSAFFAPPPLPASG